MVPNFKRFLLPNPHIPALSIEEIHYLNWEDKVREWERWTDGWINRNKDKELLLLPFLGGHTCQL